MNNIKELPQSQTPDERCLLYGPETLSDAELLAVIIRTGTTGMNAIDVAFQILKGKQNSLLNLYDYSYEELASLPGIGRVKALQLLCVGQLSKRLSSTYARAHLTMTNAASIADYYMEKLRHECREFFIIAMFDNKCRLIDDCIISIGTVKESIVSPREVFIQALRHKAVHIVAIHNHPSGNPTPSSQDFEVTNRLYEGGNLLGINLTDHIIIGDHSYYSFRQSRSLS